MDLLKSTLMLSHQKIQDWITEMKDLCGPNNVYLCDGYKEEYEAICLELVTRSVFIPLNETKRPGSYWCHSDPNDVARVEDRTFICSEKEEDAGPTNNWKDPKEMREILHSLFKGCMEGRTMYVLPFIMGPFHSPLSMIGIQITDSPYVVANMYVMSRMGKNALDIIRADGNFVPCIHSVGVPLKPGQKDPLWPCNAEKKYFVQFPEERSIWSFG